MIEVKPQIIEYYDFMGDMWYAIEEKHNIDLHDVLNMDFSKPDSEDNVYANFWHWCLKLWDGQFEKGKPITDVDWNEIYVWASKPHYWGGKDDYVQPEWVLKCIKLFADEFGHLGEHTIIVDW